MEHAFPLVMGSDAAGVVEKTGPGVTRFRPGERVYGQFMRLPQGQGSYAEYTLAEQDGKIKLGDAPAVVAKARAGHATGKTVIVP